MRVESLIIIDTVREGPCHCITAKQGDSGTRYILVTLTVCGKPIDIPDNVDLILNCSKPDGTYTETEGQLVNGKIEFELTEQTLAVIGDVKAEVQVLSVEDNKILTSAEFAIRVLPGVISDELIESTSEFKVLVDALARVESIEAVDKKIETLIGEDENKSVRTIFSESITEKITSDLIQEAVDDYTASKADELKGETGVVPSELADGAVTSKKIADKAVTLEKIDFIHLEKGDNLFNKDAATAGYYVSYSSGKLSASDKFVVSDYIEIEANETYAMSSFAGGAQTAFYDADKNFISGVLHTVSVLTATSPADAKYMRTTTTTTNLATFAVCKGTTAAYSAYVESWKIDRDVLPDSGVPMIVVALDGSGNYTSVTEAVKNAASGSIIYVRNGEYDNEEIEAWGKTVSIIGEDKHKTIIKNGLNTYSRPPIEMASGLLRNLTIYAYDGGEASLDDNGWFAYGLHVEANILSGNSLTVENCIIKCDKNAAIGAGLRKDGVLSISNCELWGTKGLFWHDAASSSYAGEETIIVKDCVIGSYNSTTAMRVDSQCQAGAVVNCHFVRNVFCSEVGEAVVFFNNTGSGTATEVGTFGDLIGFYKGSDCYMNTISTLNNSVEAVSTTGCTLVDANTGITYELQVVDGKLTMVEV